MATLFSDILRGFTVLVAMLSRRQFVLIAVRAVAIVGVFSASRASATCGDWLAHPTKASTDEVSTEIADAGGDVAPVSTRPRSRPCQGPFCGKAPWVPAAPSPAPVPTFTDHTLAVLALHGVSSEHDEVISLLTLDDADALAGFGRRIDHPPRA